MKDELEPECAGLAALQSRDPRRGLIQEETVQARAALLAAADEGVHRHARGGRAPQLLKRSPEPNRFTGKLT